jgi:hypothetical protein
MQLAMIVQQIAVSQGWAMRVDANGDVLVEIPTHPGRTQVVSIHQVVDPSQETIVYLWSAAADAARVTDPWALLRHSTAMAYGSIALKDGRIGVKHTVRFAGADHVELARAIFSVAQTADRLEAEAHGGFDAL